LKEEDHIELRSEEFQDILGSVPPWILRWGITVLAAIIIMLLVGSAVFKYPDIISSRITITGEVPPATIVARSSGKLNELYVNDNQEVKVGDYLAIIDNPARTEDVLGLKKYIETFDIESITPVSLPDKKLKLGSLQTVYSSFYATLFDYLEYKRLQYHPQKIQMIRERIALYEEQYESLLHQQKIIEEQFELTQKQFARDSSLNKRGGVSNKELENSRSQYLQGLLSLENMESSQNNMQMQIKQLNESLFENNHQDTEKFNGLQSNLRSLIAQIKAEIQSWEMNYVLAAPIDGKISFTNYWVVNQNIPAGAEIFTIIPTGDFQLIGKALLPIARSGKVKIGQKVNIRIENFPDNEYGILRGTVHNISIVPVREGEAANYTLEISLPEKLLTTYQKELPYLPNMRGQADIITEDISLLERFFLPIKKILMENR